MAYRLISNWLGGALATAAMICPMAVQAAEITDWSFDEAETELGFSLPESVIPQFFMLAEPARIVLDIPNTQVGDITADQSYSGTVERIRVSQFDANTVRVVMDLAPGTVLKPQQADIQFNDLAGQRQWLFRPLVAGQNTAVASQTTPTLPLPPTEPGVTSTSAALPEERPEGVPEHNAETFSDNGAIDITVTPVVSQPTLNQSIATSSAPPSDASLVPADGEGPISFSAASLQITARPHTPTVNSLPTDVYETPSTGNVVTVPSITASESPVNPPMTTVPSTEATEVSVPSIGEASPSTVTTEVTVPPIALSPPTPASSEVSVPAMVAPTLETDNPESIPPDSNGVAAPADNLPNLTTSPTPTALAPEPTSPDITLPENRPEPTINHTDEVAENEVVGNEVAADEVAGHEAVAEQGIEGNSSLDVATAPSPTSTIEVPIVPAFVEPDANAARPVPANNSLPENSPTDQQTATNENELEVDPIDTINTAETNSPPPQTTSPIATINPGQQVAEGPLPPSATVPQVIQLPAQSNPTAANRWPTPIQFGQPLPE